GLGDAHLMEFDDGRLTKSGDYEVYVLGQWRRIEPWKITTNEVNPSGKAIVWYDADLPEEDDAAVRVIIFCFKPLDTYWTPSGGIGPGDRGGETAKSATIAVMRTIT